MFLPDIDYDPIPAAAGLILADLGIDADAVREALVDDQVRRCPDHEAAEPESWREAREG